MQHPRPDQSAEALQKCYTYVKAPAGTDDAAHEDRPLAWRLLHYGAQARKHVVCSALQRVLAALTPQEALAAFDTPESRLEYVWFCFGQKDWQRLYAFIDEMPDADLAGIPAHVCDLQAMGIQRLTTGGFRDAARTDLAKARWRRLCDRAGTVWPQDVVRHRLYAALRDHVHGDVAGARGVLARAARPSPFVGPLRAVDSVLAPEGQAATHSPDVSVEKVSTASEVMVLSVDQRYFDRYFERCVASLYGAPGVSMNEDWGLHVHCVNFTPKLPEALAPISERIGITVDRTYPDLESTTFYAAYCAGARYLYLPELLDHYETALVCDVDGRVARPLDGEVAVSPHADVLVTARVFMAPDKGMNPLPWNSMGAASTYYRATPGARAFAEATADYLGRALLRPDDPGFRWYCDQNALFYAFIDTRDRVAFDSFRTNVFAQGMDYRQFTGLAEKVRVQGK